MYFINSFIFTKIEFMDKAQLLDDSVVEYGGLTFTSTAKDFLLQTSRWVKFLAISSFIMIGFMLLFFISFSTVLLSTVSLRLGLSGYKPILALASCVLGFALMIYPALRLLQFAISAKKAVLSEDKYMLETCFKRLRSFYRFQGILLIIFLAIYFSGIVFFLIMGSSFAL